MWEAVYSDTLFHYFLFVSAMFTWASVAEMMSPLTRDSNVYACVGVCSLRNLFFHVGFNKPAFDQFIGLMICKSSWAYRSWNVKLSVGLRVSNTMHRCMGLLCYLQYHSSSCTMSRDMLGMSSRGEIPRPAKVLLMLCFFFSSQDGAGGESAEYKDLLKACDLF